MCFIGPRATPWRRQKSGRPSRPTSGAARSQPWELATWSWSIRRTGPHGTRREAKTPAQPGWDGPYKVLEAFPQTSNYKHELPRPRPSRLPRFEARAHPVCPASKLKSSNCTTQPLSPRAARLAQNRSTSEEGVRRRGRRRREGERSGETILGEVERYADSQDTWEPVANVEDTGAEEARERGSRRGRCALCWVEAGGL